MDDYKRMGEKHEKHEINHVQNEIFVFKLM